MPDDKLIASMLVPAFCDPSPDPASPGRVRLAFVAHTMFFHEAGQIAVQLDRLASSGLSNADTIVRLLCESYSRAVFETIFAQHFDKADPRADEHLLSAVRGVYGDDVARRVHEAVAARGVVVSR